MANSNPVSFNNRHLVQILYKLSNEEIYQARLSVLLCANPETIKRLHGGNRNKDTESAYWITESKWRDHRSDYMAISGEKNKFTRLRPFFDSPTYHSPESFSELLCGLFEACCKYCQDDQKDKVFKIIEDCLKEEKIDGKYIAAVKTMKMNKSSFRVLFNTMIGWAIEATPRGKAKAKSAAAPDPIDPRLQKFIDLRARALAASLNSAKDCEEALRAADAALKCLWENRAYLCYALPELDEDDINYVPASRCVFGDQPGEEPLLYAQLLQQKNNIISKYQECSDDEGFPKEKREQLFHQALANADRIIRIANTHSIGEKVLSKSTPISDSLLRETCLDKIDLYCNLATEIPCACEEDLIATRLAPAVCELRSAAALTAGSALTAGIDNIHNTFFAPSHGLGQKLGPDFTKRAKKDVGWEELLADLKALSKPSVYLSKRDVDFSMVFPPVFSSEYDSISGQYPSNSSKLVLTTAQLLASGHIPLLQLPQVTDNNNFFKQLDDPAFRQLCQSGLIALSAYTAGKAVMIRPRDYILSCLSNDSFRFSATGWFNHENESIRRGCRQAMIAALQQGYPIRYYARYFPPEALDDMERLYSAYRLVNEAFLPSHISLYHQDPAIRTAAQPWATYPQQTLPVLVGRRIGELIEDDMNCPMPGRSDLLLRLEGLHQDALEEGCFTRSDYENLIDRRRGSEDHRTLDKFHNLINYCYNLSNGRRSCNSVFSVQNDDELRLHIDRPGEISRLSGGALAVKYVYEQHKSRSANTGLTYRDLSELVFDIRKQMKDEAIRAQSLAHQLKKETGLGYEQIAPGRVIVSDMTVAVSQGENINVSIEPKKDAVKEGIEMNG